MEKAMALVWLKYLTLPNVVNIFTLLHHKKLPFFNLPHNTCIVQGLNVFWCSLSYKLNVTQKLIFHVTVTAIGSAPDVSKEVVPDISISSHTPSMSSGDEVIWCFVTEDICTDAPSIPANTITVSTSAGVITIDETVTMSSGTPAISTGNTHGLSVGPTVNAGSKKRCMFGNNTSGVSHGPTQPSASGNSSSSTSYRSNFSKCVISFHTVLLANTYLLCKDIVESWYEQTNHICTLIIKYSCFIL